MQKRWRKDFKIQRWWMAPRSNVFQIQQDRCTHGLTDTVTAHIRSTQVQIRQCSSTEKGKWTQSSVPYQDAVSDWCMLRKEISFLQWSVTKSICHTPGEMPCSGAGGPLKSDSMFLFVELKTKGLCWRKETQFWAEIEWAVGDMREAGPNASWRRWKVWQSRSQNSKTMLRKDKGINRYLGGRSSSFLGMNLNS